MEIKAVINEKYSEMEVHVCNDTLTDEVKNVVLELGNFFNKEIAVKNEDSEKFLIHARDIVYVFAEGGKVFVHTKQGDYEAYSKLYEIEAMLDPKMFFRISKSEVVNLKKIKKLDLKMTGTIKVIMNDGSECFTSRRNVTALKKALGV